MRSKMPSLLMFTLEYKIKFIPDPASYRVLPQSPVHRKQNGGITHDNGDWMISLGNSDIPVGTVTFGDCTLAFVMAASVCVTS